MKSGNLNFLGPSGPFQACNGTALPLPLLFQVYLIWCTTLFSLRARAIQYLLHTVETETNWRSCSRSRISLTLCQQDNKPDKHKCLHLHEPFSVSIRHRHRAYFLQQEAVLWGAVNLISSPSRSMKGVLLECRKRKELGCHKLLRNPRIRSGIKPLKYLLIQRLKLVSTTTRSVQALRFAGSLYLFIIIKLNLQLWYFR